MNPYTCYSTNALLKMRAIWNARHPDAKIISSNNIEIWGFLKKKMNETCNRESCWLKQKIFKYGIPKEIKQFTFVPTSPKEWKKKPNEWLTSHEISQSMKQYEVAYPHFEFFGPSPVDYNTHRVEGECVWEELCKFNLLNEIQSGKTKIGVIFNHDPHDLPGSHWICLFIDTRKKYILYFDSYGDKPPKEIKFFINTVKKQSNKLGTPYKVIINKVRHQYSTSECGMYSLYVIITLLKGMDVNKLISKKIPDRLVFKLRKKYFN